MKKPGNVDQKNEQSQERMITMKSLERLRNDLSQDSSKPIIQKKTRNTMTKIKSQKSQQEDTADTQKSSATEVYQLNK